MNWQNDNTIWKTAYEILSTDLFTNPAFYSQRRARKRPGAGGVFFTMPGKIFTIRFDAKSPPVDNFSGESR
jgi:hypothetical protein